MKKFYEFDVEDRSLLKIRSYFGSHPKGWVMSRWLNLHF